MTERTCRVGILLVPGFSQMGLALAVEPLFVANWLAGRPVYSWTTLSADGLAVRAASGAAQAVDTPLLPETPFDIVLVVASFDPRAGATDGRLLAWLRRAARAGVRVGGIETGCEIVAAAGLLDGAEVPMHWYNAAGAQERLPEVRVVRRLYSLGSGPPLSAGGAATLDLMLALIAQTADAALAREVALHLLAEGPRPAAQAQPLPAALPGGHTPAGPAPGDPAAVARRLLEAGLEDPPDVAALAAQAGVSVRHLQRLFRARFGQSVGRLRDELRMAAAHQLVQQTALPLSEVAAACGFSGLSVFSRRYRARFGVAPSRDRRQSTESSVFRPAPLRSGHPDG